MDPKAVNARDMRLGWLEAFVSTAQHLSYADAASDLGVSPASVKQDVASLELWLHRVLILDGSPVELHRPDAEDFLPVAVKALASARSLVAHQTAHLNGSPLADVWLSDLRSIVALRQCRFYKEAAHALSCSHDQVRRKLKKLERVFAQILVSGHSEIYLTQFGDRLAKVAQNIDHDLIGSVVAIPDDYDPLSDPVPDLRLLAIARKAELSVIISRVERKKKPSKYDRVNLELARKALVIVDKVIESTAGRPHSIIGRDVSFPRQGDI